jgi:hypothetical protein
MGHVSVAASARFFGIPQVDRGLTGRSYTKHGHGNEVNGLILNGPAILLAIGPANTHTRQHKKMHDLLRNNEVFDIYCCSVRALSDGGLAPRINL